MELSRLLRPVHTCYAAFPAHPKQKIETDSDSSIRIKSQSFYSRIIVDARPKTRSPYMISLVSVEGVGWL